MIIYTENIIRNHRKKLIAAALVLVMTVAGGIVFNSLHAEKNEDTGVKLKSISQPVYLCSDDMAEYYKGKFTLDEVKSKKVPPYKAFEFEYSIPTDGDLNIEGRTYALDKSKSKITLDNLLSNHHYSYTVTVGEKSCDGSFDTADTNRFIYMDGAKNTRDIGGYKTESGKRIKQGMIIRGTELDGFIEKDYKLNSDAQSKYFNFKYDMDLRSPSVAKGEYTSPLGKNVKHVFFNAPMYEGALEESSRSTVKRIFDDLANPSNYPMYLHCTYGADRTGTMVYLLQGLLGADKKDMVFEYRLTGFFLQGYSGSLLEKMQEKINTYPGETQSQKIEYFLVNDAGVSRENISKIKELLLEEAQ